MEPSGHATALFRWWISVEQGDRLILEHPHLDWIHTGSTGVDHILTPAFRSRAITLTSSRGVHAPSIADWVVGAMLNVEKGFEAISRQQREKLWRQVERDELSARHVVLVGGGAIAAAVAHRLRPFGCTLTVITRSGSSGIDAHHVGSRGDMEAAAAACDWMILALPLTADTRNLVDRQLLAQLRPGSWIINVSRGEVLEQRALIDSLSSGAIGGAVLDVFEEEPLPPESPLWTFPNVIVLPHTTWKSPQVKDRQIDLFVHNLLQRSRGGPLQNVVDPDLGY